MKRPNHAHALEMPIWTEWLRFEVPGIPHAKQRPRFRKTGHTFTPKATKVYELKVAWMVTAKTRGRCIAPAGIPVRVDVLAYYPKPKRLQHIRGILPKCNKQHGDLDNHLKAILDGISRSGFWDDDGQAQCNRAEGVYDDYENGRMPRSAVTIFIPVSLATHLQPTTKDQPRELLATSAAGADTRTTDAQVEQGKPRT